jgi:hypothetical protein
VRPFGGALVLQGIEIPPDGRLRHAQFPHELIERGKAANPNDVEETATTLVILHGFSLPVDSLSTENDRTQASEVTESVKRGRFRA